MGIRELPTLAKEKTPGSVAMIHMFFPFRNGALDAALLNWCWLEYLVHQEDWFLGGLGRIARPEHVIT